MASASYGARSSIDCRFVRANGFGRTRLTRVAEGCSISSDCATATPVSSPAFQKQRIGIAPGLALSQDPQLDRPVSGTRCLHLGQDQWHAARASKSGFGFIIFICFHDLSVVKHLAHQVAVLAGTVVEQGDGEESSVSNTSTPGDCWAYRTDPAGTWLTVASDEAAPPGIARLRSGASFQGNQTLDETRYWAFAPQ